MKPEDIKQFAGDVVEGCKALVKSTERKLSENIAAVAKRIDDLPVPKDGVDGKSPSSEDVAAVVEAVAAKHFGEFETRAKALLDDIEAARTGLAEQTQACALALDGLKTLMAAVKSGDKGEPGDAGKDADPAAVADLLWPRVKDLIDAIPAPQDGKAGADADPQAMREMITAAVAALPPAERGLKGDPGHDAPAITADEVRAVIEPLLAEAVAALPAAEKGKPGDKGEKGLDGADADMPAILARLDELVKAIPTPRNGVDADPEVVRAMVDEAVAAIPKPQDGEDGQRGEPGRDAIQIDVLPAIDVARAYPRGTFARHKGGMWRTFKTSAPGTALDGWECVVDGVDSIEFKHDIGDPHVLFVGVTKSSGEQSHEHVHMPVMIYRGVFVDGKEYEQGDTVTWARSTWVCLRGTKAKPEPGPDWQLAVKQAGAGASAYDIAKKAGFTGSENEWLASLRGPPGDKGRDGIDFNRLGPTGGF